MSDDAEGSFFFELYEDLPRQGPGSEASTREALRRLAPLPAAPRILDVGCGSGAQTLVLARETGGTVVAVDLHQPFLDRLESRAEAAGLAERIIVRRASMDALPDEPESYDLIWSEGAAYTIGVERALHLWRPLLRAGGALAFSELTWLTPEPPAEVHAYLNEAYPAMRDRAGNRALIEGAGYEIVDDFTLPPEDWLEEYYEPMRRRLASLSDRAAREPAVAGALAEAEREIEIYERFGPTYGYVFFLARKPSR